MKRSLLFAWLVIFVIAVRAQTPGISMQRCLGNKDNTLLHSAIRTSDGGYIMCGHTTGNSGDVTGCMGNSDSWIVKLNQQGAIEWQTCLGWFSSWLFDIIQTSDGGYVVGGTSHFDEFTVMLSGGYDDIIIKLSPNGQVEWRKIYGGDSDDDLFKIIQTPDGGFMCLGETSSNTSYVSGLHFPVNNVGLKPNDLWVFKLSASGAFEWQRCYGGIGEDTGGDIIATSDGNYIISGSCNGVSGDVSTSLGGTDAWVLKISPSGNIIWEKTYGGSVNEGAANVVKASDGGYILCYSTKSLNGGSLGNHGATDIALVKIAEDGSVVWSKCYGGSLVDDIETMQAYNGATNSLASTSDGGYIICGKTQSNDGDVLGVHNVSSGKFDIWTFKVNQNGNIQWQKTLGGSNEDFGVCVMEDNSPNSFVILANAGSNDGDVFRNKIIPSAPPVYNGWFLRLSAVNTITGTVYRDLNSNGTKDSVEPFVSNVTITSQKNDGSENGGYSDTNGFFKILVDTGSYITKINSNPYYTTVPASATTSRVNYFNTDSISFGIQAIPGITDLVVNSFPITPARRGFSVSYRVVITNVGTSNTSNTTIKFIKDHKLDFLSSYPVSSVTSDTVILNNVNLNVGDSMGVTLNFNANFLTFIGDTLKNKAIVVPPGIDQTPFNDTMFVKQIVTGSYDPNDKTEIHGGKIPSTFSSSGSNFQYSIRFQNTGNDTAFIVVVKDTLDSKLDGSTFEMIAASHPYSVSIKNGNVLTWTFYNIKLVDSIRNEPASHGYIVFTIKPKTTLGLGDVIHNDASIYFDFNAPVVTNDAITVVQNEFTLLPINLFSFSGSVGNHTTLLNWNVSNAISFNKFEIERSINGVNFSTIGIKDFTGQTTYSFVDDISLLNSDVAYYRLKLVENDSRYSYSSTLIFRLDHNAEALMIFPNPVKSILHVQASGNNEKCNYAIIDAQGKQIKKGIVTLRGKTSFLVDIQDLPLGSYFFVIYQNNQTKVSVFNKN